MKICKYRMEIDECHHPLMVLEQSFEYDEAILTNPDKIVNMLNDCFRLKYMAEEYVYMIAFDNRMSPVGVFEISHGNVSACIVNVREIFLRALCCGAVNIVIAHNHPSGQNKPSAEDLNTCRNIGCAGKLLGIPLTDFIVIGDSCYSFFENGEKLY